MKMVRWLFVIAVLSGSGYGVYIPIQQYIARLNHVEWRTDTVTEGNIKSVVNSTGTVKPKLQVTIGSFVSGPIIELAAEFNQEVKKGELLARIDPQLYKSNYTRDKASLANHKAAVMRVQAELQQAVNDEKRAVSLRSGDKSFLAQAEMDKFEFTRLSLEAQLQSAQTAVEQAEATMENSLANLNYTEIRAPVDGIIINRKIDPGQTVAAQFQTPELFVIAPQMREEMYIHALVDEADIGMIKSAQQEQLPVSFTVDAYPDELFEGRVFEVRLSSTTTQNVVTYPVIVSAPNPDLKLLPGMTANISFEVAHCENVIKVPNAALRFYPDVKHVRPEDIPVLEGRWERSLDPDDEQAQQNQKAMSAQDRTKIHQERDQRHVWIQDGDKLRAVPVVTGLADGRYTRLIKGDLRPKDVLVTGIKATPAGGGR